MKLPRDISGKDLIRWLRKLGYEISRQTGSHIRLTRRQGGKEHHITIPAHSSIKVGTLAGIFDDVAHHFGITRAYLLKKVFNG